MPYVSLSCFNSNLRTLSCIVGVVTMASKRNFARRNKTALGPRRQAEISLKIEDLTCKTVNIVMK